MEAPGDIIVRKLTIERIEELKKTIQEQQHRYKKLKREVELVQSGQADEKLKEIWAEIQKSVVLMLQSNHIHPLFQFKDLNDGCTLFICRKKAAEAAKTAAKTAPEAAPSATPEQSEYSQVILGIIQLYNVHPLWCCSSFR